MSNETDIFTARQVANLLGIDDSRVRRLAERRGLGRKIGPVWTFTAAEIEQLRERPYGRAGEAYYKRLREQHED